MLRFCSDEHEMIMYDGEKEDCPLCKALDLVEKLLEQKNKIKDKILKKKNDDNHIKKASFKLQ